MAKQQRRRRGRSGRAVHASPTRRPRRRRVFFRIFPFAATGLLSVSLLVAPLALDPHRPADPPRQPAPSPAPATQTYDKFTSTQAPESASRKARITPADALLLQALLDQKRAAEMNRIHRQRLARQATVMPPLPPSGANPDSLKNHVIAHFPIWEPHRAARVTRRIYADGRQEHVRSAQQPFAAGSLIPQPPSLNQALVPHVQPFVPHRRNSPMPQGANRHGAR